MDPHRAVREKVVNPIGIETSKLSVTLIGHYNLEASERAARQETG